jgi:hypothetical protein
MKQMNTTVYDLHNRKKLWLKTLLFQPCYSMVVHVLRPCWLCSLCKIHPIGVPIFLITTIKVDKPPQGFRQKQGVVCFGLARMRLLVAMPGWLGKHVSPRALGALVSLTSRSLLGISGLNVYGSNRRSRISHGSDFWLQMTISTCKSSARQQGSASRIAWRPLCGPLHVLMDKLCSRFLQWF